MKMKIFELSVILIIGVFGLPSHCHVVKELTEKTFDKTIAGDSLVLVMFYAPWCGHCQEAKPHYFSASVDLAEKNKKNVLFMVNCDDKQNTGLCDKEKVEGFPTLRSYQNGKPVHDYDDEITKNNLVNFILNPPKPGQMKKLDENTQPEENAPDIPMKNVLYLTSENFTSFLTSKDHALVFFYTPWCQHCQEAKPKYELAATEFTKNVDHGKTKFFVAINCDTVANKDTCEKETVSGYPTIRYYHKGEMFSEFEDEIEKQPLLELIKNPPKEKIPPTPVEEEKNDENKEIGTDSENVDKPMEGVSVLVESNFTDFVSHPGQDTLVMFYAPWCPHCQQMKPVYQEAALQVSQIDTKKHFAAVNCELPTNKNLCTRENIEGFPTLVHYAYGAKVKEIPDEEKPTADKLVKYMTSIAAKKDEL